MNDPIVDLFKRRQEAGAAAVAEETRRMEEAARRRKAPLIARAREEIDLAFDRLAAKDYPGGLLVNLWEGPTHIGEVVVWTVDSITGRGDEGQTETTNYLYLYSNRTIGRTLYRMNKYYATELESLSVDELERLIAGLKRLGT